MRNLLGIVLVLAIIVIGVGWYRGWFTVEKSSPSSDETSINIHVDRSKAREDLHDAADEVRDATRRDKP